MEKFLRIAEACLEKNNFNSVFEISLALQSSPIRRLHQTWQEVSPEVRQKCDLHIHYIHLTFLYSNTSEMHLSLNLYNTVYSQTHFLVEIFCHIPKGCQVPPYTLFAHWFVLYIILHLYYVVYIVLIFVNMVFSGVLDTCIMYVYTK